MLPQSPQLVALHTIIRDASCSREDFIFYSDRLIRLLVEEGIRFLCALVDSYIVSLLLLLRCCYLYRPQPLAVREGHRDDADR